jgi:Ni/Co efflux regulator RcnB
MKASKTLVSAVAAVAVVGAIGMAYAQTPDTTTTPGTPAEQTMQNQVTTPDSAAPSSTDTTGFQTERPAQADRN